ncbi:Wzz/FepE/Etk N-terminal domain-containing protein [Thermomicrobium sp. 4228-Ro]|uniref:YveK family protein n=1 Tax=Thermomicrobium sp. 4228-Ro TaxID=2993937 RepID=UPI002249319C|nr:Wzz/FepE/Etk N-terminal domain-containing protein [Thermomicrobium sp. 4228-Ro]MCX2727840.1 Wzz/FepE/Etk N-terminal domain-containing protein [Thermomicrobium sp. 4228-Ro]
MELKAYLAILWRRRVIVAVVPAVALLAIVVQALQYQPRWTASATVIVTRLPQETPPDQYRYDEYYLYLTNEYTVDDFTEVVRGNVFATDVARRAEALLGSPVEPGEVQGGISVTRRNRAVLLSITARDPQRAVALATAAVDALRERGTQYFGFTDPQRQVIVQVIEQPNSAVPDTMRTRLLWAIQLVVALAAGLFLAFLADYFADALYTPEEVQHALRIPVLVTIPTASERRSRAS